MILQPGKTYLPVEIFPSGGSRSYTLRSTARIRFRCEVLGCRGWILHSAGAVQNGRLDFDILQPNATVYRWVVWADNDTEVELEIV